MSTFNLEHALEALIFASPEPLTLAQIKSVFENQGYELEPGSIEKALQTLKVRSSGLSLQEAAGGYIFRTSVEYGVLVRALLQEKPQKLSSSQLELLSIIAYRQPVTRQEIEDIRGVDCSSALKRLLTLKLVKIMGKSPGLGRPLLYGTTREFLEFFAFNSLAELPSLKEFQDLNKNDVPEETAKNEVLQIRDLFSTEPFFSETSDQENEEALKELDRALGALPPSFNNNAATKVDLS